MIIKEGTIEVMQNGATRRAGPGSVVFQASNEMHGFRNIGTTQATYHVIKWYSPGSLKQKP
jgi:quercetin dioxygenase-like cupin family protein